MTTNRLIHEQSPYLLQHAHNPVDWYPWGDDAFAAAREQDKPIFLSIGYATCHWCHVMERESFEDDEVARLMNETFVNVKVDREERPDVDGIYMTVAQMLTGQGGWPLTILMTHDRRPFFAATYIPKQNRYGRLGMLGLVPRIRTAWNEHRDALLSSAREIGEQLKLVATAETAATTLDQTTLELGFQQLARSFDREHAGFGRAPKFPTPHVLLFLLRYWRRSRVGVALDMVQATLAAMRAGGIFDQLGFGLHRYSTDERWLVPHFEKMLYDQALLALACAETMQAAPSPAVERMLREILIYVSRDMTAPDGGFFSAEDADSEGEEGKFYVWTLDELRDVLGDEADMAAEAWGVVASGNFADEASGVRSSANILHFARRLDEIARRRAMEPDELVQRLDHARRQLFDRRATRVRPLRDDKILTDWNGLMIAAFARAGAVLGDDSYVDVAKRAADFAHRSLRRDDVLLHRFRDGDAAIDGNLDDYAFLAWGEIEIHQATLDAEHLRRARELTDVMLERFWDAERGGLFFSPPDREDLIVRRKEIYDGAVPSGNSVAMYNLVRLGRLTGRAPYEQRAAELASAFSRQVAAHPSSFALFLCGLDMALGSSEEIVIVGDRDDPATRELLDVARRGFRPSRVLLWRPPGADAGLVGELAPYTTDLTTLDGRPAAYVCHDFQCERPVTNAAELARLLGNDE